MGVRAYNLAYKSALHCALVHTRNRTGLLQRAMQRRAARINVRAGRARARARAYDDNYHALPSTGNL